jgi:hypothetical protein
VELAARPPILKRQRPKGGRASLTIYRLVGAILLEQNDEWSVQGARYMTLETIATLSDDATVSLPAMAD